MHILSSSHECPDTLEHANFLSDVLTIVKPLLFTDESSVSLSKFKDGTPYTHTVVVKSYVKQKLTPLQREQVETEAQLLSILTHEHVAPLLAAVEDARAIHLIMPWCDGGDLRQHMASLRVPPPSPTPRPLPQTSSATTSTACDQRTCPPLSLNAATSNISHHSHYTQATVCSDGGRGMHCCTGASQHNHSNIRPDQKGFECVGNADSSSSSETNNVDSTSTSSSCSSSSSSSSCSSSSSGSCEVEARLRDFLLHPLLRALALLQQQGIVHRDISPKNILVHQGKAKLSDFGLSVHVPPPAPSTQGDVYVTAPSTIVAAASAARSGNAGNSGPSPPDPALCNSLGSSGNKLGSSNLGTNFAFPASAFSSPFSTSAPCSAYPASAPSSVSRLESTLRDSIDSGCSSGSGSIHSGVLLGCDSTPQAQGTLIGTLHEGLQQQQRHQQTTSLAHTVHKEPALPEEQLNQQQQQQQQQPPRPLHAHTHPEKSWLPRTRSSPELMSSVSGTPLYAAPEVLQAVFRNQQVHPNIHHKNDVWALGVIAVEGLTGRHPFSQGGVGMAMQGGPSAQAWCPGYGSSSGSSDANVLFSISSGQQLRLPPQLSPECADLLSAMLQRDPAQRATASQLLTHPFITQQVHKEAGGHALAHHRVSPSKHANGELPPRPPPPRS